jgi:hypothetical protein
MHFVETILGQITRALFPWEPEALIPKKIKIN